MEITDETRDETITMTNRTIGTSTTEMCGNTTCTTNHARTFMGVNLRNQLYLLNLCAICMCMEGRNQESVLTCAAWNMRGVGASKPYIQELMAAVDILALSEHQLYECELWKLMT